VDLYPTTKGRLLRSCSIQMVPNATPLIVDCFPGQVISSVSSDVLGTVSGAKVLAEAAWTIRRRSIANVPILAEA
jgi:hypothetical protein